jgi:type IV pilus assembly protein PilM
MSSVNGNKSEIQIAIQGLVDDLAREIQRTVGFYQIQQPNASISHMLLIGGGAKLPNLRQLLAQQLNMPVFTPNMGSTITIDDRLEPSIVQAIAGQMSVAVGLGLRGGGR